MTAEQSPQIGADPQTPTGILGNCLFDSSIPSLSPITVLQSAKFDERARSDNLEVSVDSSRPPERRDSGATVGQRRRSSAAESLSGLRPPRGGVAWRPQPLSRVGIATPLHEAADPPWFSPSRRGLVRYKTSPAAVAAVTASPRTVGGGSVADAALAAAQLLRSPELSPVMLCAGSRPRRAHRTRGHRATPMSPTSTVVFSPFPGAARQRSRRGSTGTVLTAGLENHSMVYSAGGSSPFLGPRHDDPEDIASSPKGRSAFSRRGSIADSIPHDAAPLAAVDRVSSIFLVASRRTGTASIVASHPPSPATLAACHPLLVSFCFPAEEISFACRFTFTLTDAQRRLLHGHALQLPNDLCLCFLSAQPWFSCFDGLLQAAAEELHGAVGIPTVAKDVTKQMCPGAGLHVRFGTSTAPLSCAWRVPRAAAKFPLFDTDLRPLLSAVGVPTALRLLSALLLEDRLLLVDDDVARLCGACHALLALLCPLEWPHTFVPLLPEPLLDAACAPTPWVYGVHASALSELQRLPVEHCVRVDLRTGEVDGLDDIHALPGADLLIPRLEEAVRQGTPQCLDLMLQWFASIFVGVREFAEPAVDEHGGGVLFLDADALEEAKARFGETAEFVLDVAQSTMFHLWVHRGMKGPGELVDAFGEMAREIRPDLYGGEPEQQRAATPPGGFPPDRMYGRGRTVSLMERLHSRFMLADRGPMPESEAALMPFQVGQRVAVLCGDQRWRSATVIGLNAVGAVHVRYDAGIPWEWISASAASLRISQSADVQDATAHLDGQPAKPIGERGAELLRLAAAPRRSSSLPPPPPPRSGTELVLWEGGQEVGTGRLLNGRVVATHRDTVRVQIRGGAVEVLQWNEAWQQKRVVSVDSVGDADASGGSGVC